jgi:sialidase-1
MGEKHCLAKKSFYYCIKPSVLIKISVLLITILAGISCKNRTENRGIEASLSISEVLELLPGDNNPRNSEGDFISLKDGRILFVYTHYTGTSDNDHGNAYLAGRFSENDGKTWSSDDIIIIEQEGRLNVMSVSLLRLQNGEIALFYLIKNSKIDCIPVIRISNDEAKTWSDPQPCISDQEGYFVLNNSRVIQLKNGRVLLITHIPTKQLEFNYNY